MNDVTRILSAIGHGDSHGAEQLLPLVYDELRRLASGKLAREKPGQTLQATALVHEAFLRLVDVETAQRWENRRHFFAAAAEAMRRILIENARRKQAEKHGGGRARVNLDEADLVACSSPDDLLDLDDALTELDREDPDAARLVKLRLFAGLSVEQTAEVLGVSRAAPISNGLTRGPGSTHVSKKETLRNVFEDFRPGLVDVRASDLA